MSNDFAKQKGRAPKITGSTNINHEQRIALKLNCSAYVMMAHIFKCVSNSKPLEITDTYKKTGFSGVEQQTLVQDLINTGFLYPIKGPIPRISSKWADSIPNFDKEFEDFWSIDGKVCWKGAKPIALDKYRGVRKEFSKEFLFKQRDLYFEFLVLEKKYRKFDRQRVGCPVFLGPQLRFLEDYASYIKDLKDEFEPEESAEPATEKLTAEDYKKLHE